MRIRALVRRIIRQFIRDKRTLAMMMAAPLLILSLVFLVFNGSTYKPKIGLVHVPQPIAARLTTAGAVVQTYASEATADSALRAQKADAIMRLDGSVPQVTLEGSDPSRNKSVLLLLQKAMQPTAQTAQTAQQMQAPIIRYMYGSASMTAFDNFGPVLLGVFAFFFVFIIAGIAFLKERTSGTLERLMATPLKRWEMVTGYVLGFGVFTTIQAVLLAWFAVDALGMMMNGTLVLLLLTTLLLSMTALTLGTFLSAFANSEFQMIQLIPIVIVPQVFFSGLFSVDNMAPWMRELSKVIPLTYGADALRNVMIRGKGLADIYPDLLVLLGLSVCFMIANVIALRKYRRI